MDYFGEIRWVGVHILAQSLPEEEIFVESITQIGSRFAAREVEITLEVIEERDGPWDYQVNRLQLSYTMI